jgi:UDP-2,3-diacylglucosamine hydrolase
VSTLFISDLHLDGAQPAAVESCIRLLSEEAPKHAALYILGDLFEYWLGDDAPQPALDDVFTALKQLADRGTAISVMHGNRDFLLGDDFAARSGCRLIRDDAVVETIDGIPTLLMHGDTLCTDDVDYQQFRRLVRDPGWQADFLSRSLSERIALVQNLREKSREAMQDKSAEIMDVNPDVVVSTMREHGVTRLIHGHTHRPARHTLRVDGQSAERHVLGDWRADGAQLLSSDNSGTLHELHWR